MIPKNGWKDMASAPRNGEVIMARYHPRDVARDRFSTEIWRVHPVQWLCDENGANWQWSAPGRMGAGSFALGWMTLAEFQAAQAAEEFSPTQSTEFDL
jgi:hypothetical protein